MISEFAKEKVFWTRKMNLKLVKFIQNNPNIWNPNHPKYTSVEYRDQTYANFANKYGNEFTGQAVKDRWTNIRSTFANYLRKLNASRTKEEGEVYKVKWHLWEACSFLLNVNKRNKLRKSTAECRQEEAKDNVNVKDEELSSYEDDFCNNSTNDDDSTCQNVANGLLNVFRGVQNDIFNVDNTYGNLGHTIAKRLNEMNSLEATQVSNKIMNILLLYHEDNPYNPNNIKSEDYRLFLFYRKLVEIHKLIVPWLVFGSAIYLVDPLPLLFLTIKYRKSNKYLVENSTRYLLLFLCLENLG